MDFYKRLITGPSPYWRILWILPMPTLLAISFTSPIIKIKIFNSHTYLKTGLTVFSIILLFYFLKVPSTLSSSNRTILHWPKYKMDNKNFELSKKVIKTANKENFILAPNSISYIIATFPGHPPLFAVRSDYLDYLSPWIKKEEYILRKDVFEYISGYHRTKISNSLLEQALNSYDIDFILINQNNPWAQEINDLIVKYNYILMEDNYYYVWKKKR